MAEEGHCNLCFIGNCNFQCSRCGDIYCSLKCMKDDWKRHRYICLPFPGLTPIIRDDPSITASSVVAQNNVNVQVPFVANKLEVSSAPAENGKAHFAEKTDMSPEKPISKILAESKTQTPPKLVIEEPKPPQDSIDSKIDQLSAGTKTLHLSAEKNLLKEVPKPLQNDTTKTSDIPVKPEKEVKINEPEKLSATKNEKPKEIFEDHSKDKKIEKVPEKQEFPRIPSNIIRDRFSNYNNNSSSARQVSQQNSKPRELSEESSNPTENQRNIKKPFDTAWKEILPIFNDGESFFKVIVLNMDGAKENSNIIYAMCQSYENEFEEFSRELTHRYKSQNGMDFGKIAVGMLLLTPLDSKFVYRGEVVGKSNTSKEVRVKLIDRGNELIIKNLEVLKVCPRPAFSQKRFAFQVEIENLKDKDVKEDDVIEIKMNLKKIGEVSQAIMKADARAKESDRIMLDNIDMINLPAKIPFKVNITDLSLFNEKKLITLFESNEDNLKLYEDIQFQIKKYCKDAPRNEVYTPLVNEIVLAKFEGEFFRGVIINVADDGNCQIQFTDYGNLSMVSGKDIRKLPPCLALPICAHTCSVRNFTGFLTAEIQAVLESPEVWASNVKIDRNLGCFSIEIKGLD